MYNELYQSKPSNKYIFDLTVDVFNPSRESIYFQGEMLSQGYSIGYLFSINLFYSQKIIPIFYTFSPPISLSMCCGNYKISSGLNQYHVKGLLSFSSINSSQLPDGTYSFSVSRVGRYWNSQKSNFHSEISNLVIKNGNSVFYPNVPNYDLIKTEYSIFPIIISVFITSTVLFIFIKFIEKRYTYYAPIKSKKIDNLKNK